MEYGSVIFPKYFCIAEQYILLNSSSYISLYFCIMRNISMQKTEGKIL